MPAARKALRHGTITDRVLGFLRERPDRSFSATAIGPVTGASASQAQQILSRAIARDPHYRRSGPGRYVYDSTPQNPPAPAEPAEAPPAAEAAPATVLAEAAPGGMFQAPSALVALGDRALVLVQLPDQDILIGKIVAVI